MEIAWEKHLSIKTKAGVLWIDPSSESLNKAPDTLKLAMYTQGDFGNGDIDSKTMIVRGPGEIDTGGFHLQGWRVGTQGTIYIVEVEDIKVAVIFEISDKWDKKKQERLGEADVLLVDGSKIGAKTSRELLKNTGTNYLIVLPPSQEEVKKDYTDEFDLGQEAMVPTVKVDRQNLSESLEVLILND